MAILNGEEILALNMNGGCIVDDEFNNESTNPVQNKVVTESINSINAKIEGLKTRGKIVNRTSAYTQNALGKEPISLTLKGVEPTINSNYEYREMQNSTIYVQGNQYIPRTSTINDFTLQVTRRTPDDLDMFPQDIINLYGITNDTYCAYGYDLQAWQQGVVYSQGVPLTIPIKEGKKYKLVTYFKSDTTQIPSIGLFKTPNFTSSGSVASLGDEKIYNNAGELISQTQKQYSYTSKLDCVAEEWYRSELIINAEYTGNVYYMIRPSKVMSVTIACPMLYAADNEDLWGNYTTDKTLNAIEDICDTLDITNGLYTQRISKCTLPANYSYNTFKIGNGAHSMGTTAIIIYPNGIARVTVNSMGEIPIPAECRKLSSECTIFYVLRTHITESVEPMPLFAPCEDTYIFTSSQSTPMKPLFDVEYCRDISLVIDDLTNAIIRLGGTV